MNTILNDTLITMSFPIGENPDRNTIVNALLERRAEIENTFKNDEYLKLDLTHQEIIGLKSTASITLSPKAKEIKITDLPALNHLIENNERYKGSNIINLGNVDMIYRHFCS